MFDRTVLPMKNTLLNEDEIVMLKALVVWDSLLCREVTHFRLDIGMF